MLFFFNSFHLQITKSPSRRIHLVFRDSFLHSTLEWQLECNNNWYCRFQDSNFKHYLSSLHFSSFHMAYMEHQRISWHMNYKKANTVRDKISCATSGGQKRKSDCAPLQNKLRVSQAYWKRINEHYKKIIKIYRLNLF